MKVYEIIVVNTLKRTETRIASYVPLKDVYRLTVEAHNAHCSIPGYKVYCRTQLGR